MRTSERPFWFPVVSYYVLSFAVALTLFFLVWAVLLESGEKSPFLPAGIVAGLFLIASVVLREVLMRRVRLERLEAQRRLDRNLSGVRVKASTRRTKLSIERNAVMLKAIHEKSEAARILKEVPDAHWEVFSLCDSYLKLTNREVARTHVNSPRFEPINKGRGQVRKLHRYHLLKWAREKSGVLTMESHDSSQGFDYKIDQAETAIECLETALEHYPREKKLIESHDAVLEFASTLRISQKMERADKAAEDGSTEIAVALYREVLDDLDGEFLRKREAEIIVERVHCEIERLEHR